MASCLARARGTGRDSVAEAERPGTVSAEAQANTFKTFTTTTVNADGSGSVKIERDVRGNGERFTLAELKFGGEDEPGHYVARLTGDGYIVNDGAKVGTVRDATFRTEAIDAGRTRA